MPPKDPLGLPAFARQPSIVFLVYRQALIFAEFSGVLSMKNKTLLFAALLVSANVGAENDPTPAQAHLDPLVVTASTDSGRHSRAMRSMTVLTREDTAKEIRMTSHRGGHQK